MSGDARASLQLGYRLSRCLSNRQFSSTCRLTYNSQVDLFVHVDRGPYQKAVAASASAFEWRYGAFNVTAAPTRQGLLRTILGAWSPRDAEEARH